MTHKPRWCILNNLVHISNGALPLRKSVTGYGGCKRQIDYGSHVVPEKLITYNFFSFLMNIFLSAERNL